MLNKNPVSESLVSWCFFWLATGMHCIPFFDDNYKYFETNDSDNNFILLQQRFDASCIIFNLRIKYSRFILIITVRMFVSKQLRKHAKLPNAHGKNY